MESFGLEKTLAGCVRTWSASRDFFLPVSAIEFYNP